MRSCIVVVCLLGIALAGGAEAQVVGRIVGPGATRIKLAVPELADSAGGAHGAKFAEIVRRNLSLSGYFEILDPKAYIEGSDPIELDRINFANWNVIGARALVKGTVRGTAGALEVEAKLFDVSQRAQLGGNRYRGSEGELPRMARKFADSVLRMLTGEEGPFDSRIAFVSRRAGRAKELYAMSVDGFEVVQLTNNRTINLAPAWSPQASSIFFTSYQDRNPSLYSIAFHGGAARRLSAGQGLNLGGRPSPDGSRIATSLERSGNADLYLLTADGQVDKRLTDHPEIDVSPTWSPDGSRIAFVSSRAGGPQIYVMNADGSAVKRVTFQGSYNTSPSWSPKGDLIAYVSRDRGFNVFTIHVGSGQVRQVTNGQGNNEDPSFSPDGRYLVFSSTRFGKPVLFLSDVTGSHQVQLTKSGGDDTSPAWSPRLP